jgi:CHAD domain-containing protein
MPAVRPTREGTAAPARPVELPPLIELVPAGTAADPGSGVAEGEPVRQKLVATYFDTPDLRLTAAGVTVRRRRGGDDAGWHLLGPERGGARPEVRLPLGRGARTVPAPLRSMVRVLGGGASLGPVAELSTDRTLRRLVDVTGAVVAEIADDSTSARRLPADEKAGAGVVSWREVRLVGGDAELLGEIGDRLRERGLPATAHEPGPERVLGQDGPAAGDRRPEKLERKTAAGAVVTAHVREQVEQIRTHDLPARLDVPDAVHKMRVATRRLRSALTTFKPLFDADVVRPLRGELKWLAGQLGAARDAEVLRDRVAATAGADDAAGAADLEQVLAELDRAYRRAHDGLLADLDGERYHQLLQALDELLETPPTTVRAARRTDEELPRLVGRSFTAVRRLVERAETLPAGPEREELLHDARKAAKAARYAGESVEPVFGEDAAAFAEAMEGLQEVLGEHQDSVLTRQRLRELAAATGSTEAAFLYGRLHALEEARGEGHQRRFATAWKSARRKRLHRWTR